MWWRMGQTCKPQGCRGVVTLLPVVEKGVVKDMQWGKICYVMCQRLYSQEVEGN